MLKSSNERPAANPKKAVRDRTHPAVLNQEETKTNTETKKLLNELDDLLGVPMLIVFLVGVLVLVSSWFVPRDE